MKGKYKLLLATFVVLSFSFIAYHFSLAFDGYYSIYLTISTYLVICWLATIAIWLLISNPVKRSNYLLMSVVLVFMLLCCEFLLRYVVKMNLTYGERNGVTLSQFTYTILEAEGIAKMSHVPMHGGEPYHQSEKGNQEFTFLHKNNSLGLRSPEPIYDTNVFTILALGDSFTEGYGAPADSTWVAVLQEKLKEKYPTIQVQCINAGISGSDPFFEYMLLKKLLQTIPIDVVIVAINESDVVDVIMRGGMERFVAEGSVKFPSGPWWQTFYHVSYIFRAVVHGLGDVDFLLLTDDERKIADAAALNQIKNCFENEYMAMAKQHDFNLVVVINRVLSDFDEPGPFSFGPITSLNHDSSLRVVDLYPTFKKALDSIPKDQLFWPIDMHNTPRGYALWGEALVEVIPVDNSGK